MQVISTNWIVVTGSPCCGKTTVINALRGGGYKCTPEAARVYINEELAKGRTIEDMRKDEMAFQREVVARKSAIEQILDPNELVFMDRAMPDSMSYFRLKGFDPTEIVPISCRFRYAKIFLFDRLPYEYDGARVEDERAAAFLDRQLEIDYRSLGYDVIRVPAMSVEKRVHYVTQQL